MYIDLRVKGQGKTAASCPLSTQRRPDPTPVRRYQIFAYQMTQLSVEHIPYLLVQEQNPGIYKLIRTESAALPKDASVRQLLDDAHPKACSVIGGDTLQVYTAR